MKVSYTIQKISEVLQTSHDSFYAPDALIKYLAYDTRKLHDVSESLFFAIRAKRDGHAFIEDAYAKGIRNFVVDQEHSIPQALRLQANWIIVSDTMHGLQKLAAFHRQQFKKPVIGITGSNGKTLVKEWLFQLLSKEKKVYRTPKSMNSQLGVSLCLWDLQEDYDLAIIEAGISEIGEMDALANMIRPDIGVFTNLGLSHQEGFPDLVTKGIEKSKLFQSASTWIASKKLNEVLPQSPYVGQGEFWEILNLQDLPKSSGTQIEFIFRGEKTTFNIPFRDKASIENAVHVYVCMRLLGFDDSWLSDKMPQLVPVEMRLELKKGHHDRTIIDDSYSNDPYALGIALDFLKQQQQHPVKCLILSDLAESALIGSSAVQEQEDLTRDLAYQLIANRIKESQIDVLLTLGPETYKRKGLLGVENHHAYVDLQAFMQEIPEILPASSSVLVKGARKFGFEQISRMLTAQTHQTRLEINMVALENNLRRFRKQLRPGVQTMAMVKAFSYGSGTYEIANLLQFHQIDYLAVAYADEGKALRDGGIQTPIMVMNPEPSAFAMMVACNLEPEIFNFDVLHAWGEWTSRQLPVSKTLPIHLKIDTGMHRLGFALSDEIEMIQNLKQYPQLQVKSVLSHLVASGQPDQDDFSKKQISDFKGFCSTFEKNLGYAIIKHIANTDGIARFPEAQMDMVRLGIGMYGYSDYLPGLDPVLHLKTHISQLTKVTQGQSIGYGRKGRVERDSLVATVRIGYADGYDRRFGNGTGIMQIHGVNVPTLGDICMDMCMLDVTDVPHVQVGDEVLVLADFQSAASQIGTIAYELLVGISQRVKRLYFYR